MDWVAVILRFLHIGAAMGWVGATVFFVAVVDPMMTRIGADEASRLARHLTLRSRMSVYITFMAIVAVAGGIALFFWIKGPQAYPMDTTPGLMFSLSAILGLLAFGIGARSGVISGQLQKASRTFEMRPVLDAGKRLGVLAHRLALNSRVAAGAMLLAMFGMATFRYVG